MRPSDFSGKRVLVLLEAALVPDSLETLRLLERSGALCDAFAPSQDAATRARRSTGCLVVQAALHFFSPPREVYEAAWLGESLNGVPREGVQRVLVTVFQALKPGSPLFFRVPSSEWEPNAILPLLKQSGFEPLNLVESKSRSGQLELVARRI